MRKKTVLRKYLEDNDIVQARFAEALGIKEARLSHWVTGRYKVPVCMIPAIERATGGAVSRVELLPGLYGS